MPSNIHNASISNASERQRLFPSGKHSANLQRLMTETLAQETSDLGEAVLSRLKADAQEKANKKNRFTSRLLMLMTFVVGVMLGGLAFYFVGKSSKAQQNAINPIFITDVEVDAIYDALDVFDGLLRKHRVNYWIICGTLIGSLRNQPPGALAWDDDADIGVLESEIPRLNTMLRDPAFTSVAEHQKTSFGLQLRLKRYIGRIPKKYNYDIFIFRKKIVRGAQRYAIAEPIFSKLYYKNLDEIFPLRKCQLWDKWYPCPNKLETVSREYGADIFQGAKAYNHRTSSPVTLEMQRFNQKYYLPALSRRLVKRLKFGKKSRDFATSKNVNQMHGKWDM